MFDLELRVGKKAFLIVTGTGASDCDSEIEQNVIGSHSLMSVTWIGIYTILFFFFKVSYKKGIDLVSVEVIGINVIVLVYQRVRL